MSIPALLVAWVGLTLLVVLVRARGTNPGVGLVLAFLAGMFVMFFPGALVYTNPTYVPQHDAEVVRTGLQLAVLGVAGFAAGSVLIGPVLVSGAAHVPVRGNTDGTQAQIRFYLVAGAASCFLILGVLTIVPTASALVAIGQQLFPVGLCLAIWDAKRRGDRRGFVLALGATCLLPFFTIVTQGFLGYGTAATLTVLCFMAARTKKRLSAAVIAVLMLYVGISLFQTYARDRDRLRIIIWGGAPIETRLAEVSNTLSTFQWWDPNSQDQSSRVDGRLNQSFLVGAAADHLNVTGDYAYGATLYDAAVALVPRALWPNKPVFAGSPETVSKYTGIQFNSHTSVGVGNVLELFINFGVVGVFLGFVCLGALLTYIDMEAARRLAVGDIKACIPFFLVGISFLQVGGSFVEVSGTAGAGLVVAWLVNRRISIRSNARMPRVRRRLAA